MRKMKGLVIRIREIQVPLRNSRCAGATPVQHPRCTPYKSSSGSSDPWMFDIKRKKKALLCCTTSSVHVWEYWDTSTKFLVTVAN